MFNEHNMYFQISTNNEKITQCTKKSVVLSIALVRSGTSLPVVREITLKKTYNFIIKSEMCKRYIDGHRKIKT
jgi:hypothetical protein